MNLKTALEWIAEIHSVLNNLKTSKYEDDETVQVQVVTANSVNVTNIAQLRELAIEIEQGFIRWYVSDLMSNEMLTASLIMLFNMCRNIRRL